MVVMEIWSMVEEEEVQVMEVEHTIPREVKEVEQVVTEVEEEAMVVEAMVVTEEVATEEEVFEEDEII